jgi:hypothetical protein
MHKFLSAIRDSDDEYAIQEGLSVYVDLTQFHAGTVLRCLQLCLIKEDSTGDEQTRIWVLTSCGTGCLDDEKYVPEIVKALAERKEARP